MYVSIAEASKIVGVSISTLRRWEKENKFLSDYRTIGNHRRYSLERLKSEILKIKTPESINNKKTYAYARVSSSDQKLDLVRQEKRLSKYCIDNSYNFEIISDLGSGLNCKKRGLIKLINLICHQKISRLVLTHKDRLLRFGSSLLFKLCENFGVEVVLLEQQLQKDFNQELVADVIELMTVFTARMYGKRSHQNKKKLASG